MKTFKDTKYGDLTGKVYERNINVSSMDLDTLEGAPKEVHGNFWCSFNNFKNLKGVPKVVEGDFWCTYNENLTSLEGGLKEVYGDFNCSHNKNLKSLKGAPEVVEGNFWCIFNENLTSLEGAPKVVEGNFNCKECSELTSIDELLGTEIRGKLESDLMTNEEFRENQVLYNKVKGNMKKYKILKKLKG